MTPALEAAYAEPHRRYHTRRHIEECLELLAQTDGLSDHDRRLLEQAIWWHDAIYDPRRSDNEERSAAWAERELIAAGESPVDASEVGRLIRLTRGHAAAAGDRRGALLVSIDLAILGAAPGRYAQYAAAVRAEHAHVPDAAFRAGRRTVLETFLGAATLFADPAFQARFGAPARTNLRAELATLL